MKTTNTLRILAGLSFLIFFCPFFDMCSRHEAVPAETGFETEVGAGTETLPQPEPQVTDNKIADDSTLNGYQVASTFTLSVLENRLDLHEKDAWQDPVVYGVLFFVFATLTTLSIFVLTILKKYRTVFILSCINLLFLVAETITLFLPNGLVEELYQIKFGYYLFVVNSIALIFVSYKAKNQPVNGV